ncbi:MAG: hypothetical protein P4M11_01940 [Candidatus Pacebacteria bacterium]|nr:hypothetical protein [Candidatus Paceibacterota bacterium]
MCKSLFDDDLRVLVTDENFLEMVMIQNDRHLHRGVLNGWWDDVDEKRRQPIPFPIIVNIHGKPEGTTMAHVFHEAGLFKSVSDARKQGWNKKVELGEHFLFKRTKRVLIIDEATND